MARTTVFLVVLLMICSSYVHATSLWQEGCNLFADNKASQMGDLITVLIIEQNTASQSADTTTGQEFGIDLDPGVFLSDLIFSLSPQYSDGASAHGRTTRSGSIIAEVTVVIVEVLPGGNFRVEGTKMLTVNGERETIVLRGIVRPEDISSGNIVESSKLADVEISYTGQGVISAKQRPSFIEWLLNWLF